MLKTVYPVKCVVSGDPCAGTMAAITKFVYGESIDDYDPTVSYTKYLSQSNKRNLGAIYNIILLKLKTYTANFMHIIHGSRNR